MQAELFDLLKKTLKARGITYADLARQLDLSEPTIKRIFADRDCKLGRLTEICTVLNLTLDDLVSETRRVEVRPTVLGDKTEAALAADPPALHVFLLLLDAMPATAIQAKYELSDTRIFDLGRRLEKLGLVEVHAANRIRLAVRAPVHFRRDGPLHARLLKLNLDFLREAYIGADTDTAGFMTLTRRITERTALHIRTRLREVQMELSDLARKDQLTQPEDALETFKLSTAFAQVEFSHLLEIPKD